MFRIQEEIKEFLEENNMAIAELADKIGVTRQNLHRFLTKEQKNIGLTIAENFTEMKYIKDEATSNVDPDTEEEDDTWEMTEEETEMLKQDMEESSPLDLLDDDDEEDEWE